jgi:hypothetical protein
VPAQARQLLDALGRYAIYTPITAVLRGTTSDDTHEAPVGLAGGRLAEALREVMAWLNHRDHEDARFALFRLLDWVDRFGLERRIDDILSPEVPRLRHMLVLRDRRMKRGSDELTAYDASEGVLYVLFLAVLALHPQMPPVFAVGNFDTAMHPQLCRGSTRFFCQHVLESSPPRQVLLTTHSPLALDGLDLSDDRIRLFAVERDPRGSTACRRVTVSAEVLDTSDPDRSLSQLWIMGRLGGVPDVW